MDLIFKITGLLSVFVSANSMADIPFVAVDSREQLMHLQEQSKIEMPQTIGERFYDFIQETVGANQGQFGMKDVINLFQTSNPKSDLLKLIENSYSYNFPGEKIFEQNITEGKIGIRVVVKRIDDRRIAAHFSGLLNGLEISFKNPNVATFLALAHMHEHEVFDGIKYPKVADSIATQIYRLFKEKDLFQFDSNFEFYSFCLGGLVADRLAHKIATNMSESQIFHLSFASPRSTNLYERMIETRNIKRINIIRTSDMIVKICNWRMGFTRPNGFELLFSDSDFKPANGYLSNFFWSLLNPIQSHTESQFHAWCVVDGHGC